MVDTYQYDVRHSEALEPGKFPMMSFQQKVDTKESEDQNAKSDDCHYGRFTTPPTDGEPFMQKDCIKNPSDPGPNLLGVPTPESTPNRFGIYKTGNEP